MEIFLLRLTSLILVFLLSSCSNVKALGRIEEKPYKIVFLKPGENKKTTKKSKKRVRKNKKRDHVEYVKHRQSSIKRKKVKTTYSKKKKKVSYKKYNKKRSKPRKQRNLITEQTYKFGNQTLSFSKKHLDHQSLLKPFHSEFVWYFAINSFSNCRAGHLNFQ